MKNTYLILFLLTIFSYQLVGAAPTITPLSSGAIQINHNPDHKNVSKKRLKLKDRFQQWKMRTAVKILQKFAHKKSSPNESDKIKNHGNKSLLFALVAFLGFLISSIVITIGLFASSILIFGILLAITSEIFGILSFFKGIKGIKYDKKPNNAIAGLIFGAFFVIVILLLIIFLGQIIG